MRHIDGVQFHWHDYSDKGYLAALRHLLDLKQEGLISNIGLVNFDTIRVDEICVQLGPGAIATHQVQVRQRPVGRAVPTWNSTHVT